MREPLSLGLLGVEVFISRSSWRGGLHLQAFLAWQIFVHECRARLNALEWLVLVTESSSTLGVVDVVVVVEVNV